MTNDAPPASMQDPHTPSDADLRLVAEAVGFRPGPTEDWQNDNLEPFKRFTWFWPDSNRPHYMMPDLRVDDVAAVRWLLPWLQRRFGATGLCIKADGGEWRAWGHVDAHGRDAARSEFRPTLAAALFDLCLSIIKENQS